MYFPKKDRWWGGGGGGGGGGGQGAGLKFPLAPPLSSFRVKRILVIQECCRVFLLPEVVLKKVQDRVYLRKHLKIFIGIVGVRY